LLFLVGCTVSAQQGDVTPTITPPASPSPTDVASTTTPAHPSLADQWLAAHDRPMTTTALIYGHSHIVDASPIANGFWRMRLDTGGQVQPIATFSRRDSAFSGHLSADAQ
jgi:hypothetical protein